MTLALSLIVLIDVLLLAAVVAGRWPRPGDGRWMPMSPSLRAGLVAVALALACAGFAARQGWLGAAPSSAPALVYSSPGVQRPVAPLWDESQANAVPSTQAEPAASGAAPLLPRSTLAPMPEPTPLPASIDRPALPDPPAKPAPMPPSARPNNTEAAPRRGNEAAGDCPSPLPANGEPMTIVRIADRLGPGQRRERLSITVEGCGTVRIELTRARPRAELRVRVPPSGAMYRLDGDTDYDDGRRLTIAGEGWLDAEATRYELRVLDEYSGVYQLEPQY